MQLHSKEIVNHEPKKGKKKMEENLPSPPVTGEMPIKQLIVVVFPAPFGPRRQNS